MSTLAAYRDDGPLAVAVGGIIRIWWIDPIMLALFGALPLTLALAVEQRPGPNVAVSLAWWIVLAGGSTARSLVGRLDWLMPVLLRSVEYGFVIWLVAETDPAALPWAYATLFAASIHQYETVYRIRHMGGPPPNWVGQVTGGYDGRMILVALLAAADALGPGLAAYAGVVGAFYVAESVMAWSRLRG